MSTAAGTLGYSVTPNMLSGTPRSRKPPITAVKPRIEPTDRSMPPVSTTSSCPRDSSAKIATCEDMISRLLTVRKFGDSSEKMTMISARARKARLSMRTLEMSSEERSRVQEPDVDEPRFELSGVGLSGVGLSGIRGASPAAVEVMRRIRSGSRVRRRRLRRRRP